MGERKIEHIETVNDSKPKEGRETATRGSVVQDPLLKVMINYPEPTPLARVIADVAIWSGEAFVMDPSSNPKIQIFAPNKLAADDAYKLFLSSLSILGLRAVKVGPVTKIVPLKGVITA